MKNSDIKYNLSTDYNKLYELIREGINIIGFIAIEINEKIDLNHSKLIIIRFHNTDYQMYDFGCMSFFEQDVNKKGFITICNRYKVRFINPDKLN